MTLCLALLPLSSAHKSFEEMFSIFRKSDFRTVHRPYPDDKSSHILVGFRPCINTSLKGGCWLSTWLFFVCLPRSTKSASGWLAALTPLSIARVEIFHQKVVAHCRVILLREQQAVNTACAAPGTATTCMAGQPCIAQLRGQDESPRCMVSTRPNSCSARPASPPPQWQVSPPPSSAACHERGLAPSVLLGVAGPRLASSRPALRLWVWSGATGPAGEAPQ